MSLNPPLSPSQLVAALQHTPEEIPFEQVMACIDAHYQFTPTAFTNGALRNAAGENNGSCKLLAFAQLHRLPEAATLAGFGRYYRNDVLGNPEGEDHQNIRNFMRSGWAGVAFEQFPLQAR